MKSRLFIGSSADALDIARAVQDSLSKDAEIIVWDQDIIQPSNYVLESLLYEVGKSSFGVFVLSPDDTLSIRNKELPAARDNVIFELGLFVGRHGRQRCYYLIPEGYEMHLPSDLHGVTALTYDFNRSDKNLHAAVAPACNRIRSALQYSIHHKENLSRRQILFYGEGVDIPMKSIRLVSGDFSVRDPIQYTFESGELQIKGKDISFNANYKSNISPSEQHIGRITGEGVYQEGIGYLIYEGTEFESKVSWNGVLCIRIPEHGQIRGYWLVKHLWEMGLFGFGRVVLERSNKANSADAKKRRG